VHVVRISTQEARFAQHVDRELDDVDVMMMRAGAFGHPRILHDGRPPWRVLIRAVNVKSSD
jgi:hypothetical protein